MCDTVGISRESTADGVVLFAKNSDREPDEAQRLEWFGAQEHPAGSRLEATYLTLPQVASTRALLLSRPYWMWGGEMGVNDAGVAIGNEAVFTTAQARRPALLGMDLVRLGLERATSAERAVDVIASLLEEHGQGGPAGYRDRNFHYDSSFLIADPESVFVLETAGRAWVAKRVSGVRAISNGLTLRDDWDRGCDGLAARARDAGRDPGRGKLDFAGTFGVRWLALAANAKARRRCSEEALRARGTTLAVADALAALRAHGPVDRPARSLAAPLGTVCAHASYWPTRRAGQTTASLVAHLGASSITAFATGTSAPCTSVFKPVWVDAEVAGYGAPSARYEPSQLWWRHERVHRRALGALDETRRRFGVEQRDLEARSVERALGATRGCAERRELARAALDEAAGLTDRLEQRLGRRYPTGALGAYWRSIDRRTGLLAALDEVPV